MTYNTPSNVDFKTSSVKKGFIFFDLESLRIMPRFKKRMIKDLSITDDGRTKIVRVEPNKKKWPTDHYF